MWNDIWIYHRFNQFLPEKAILRKWISPCRASPYQKDMVAMWDTLHIIEDLKYYDLESAIEMLKVHFDLFRESDGMCAQDYKISRDFAPKIFGRWLNEKT